MFGLDADSVMPLIYLVIPAWICIICLPHWRLTRFVTMAPPFLLSSLYCIVMIPEIYKKGIWYFVDLIQTKEGVSELFTNNQIALGGWIHYAIFGQLVGRWILFDAKAQGVPHWLVIPSLLLTLALGPVGWLSYVLIRGFFTTAHARR
eukprot:TRINITY_DN776210_c0_g1_i1.p1 TRINITY_DN776210_c0_g1~~TRINITY_DN776210_c0_g1_i1.p1  ORF type:complete len:148 (-),score=14.49 TRINITY_DN776210_c0_g1_i1:200-643(-)